MKVCVYTSRHTCVTLYTCCAYDITTYVGRVFVFKKESRPRELRIFFAGSQQSCTLNFIFLSFLGILIMELKLTPKQIEILLYIEREHLPHIIQSTTKRTVILEPTLLDSLESRLNTMACISSVFGRILAKIATKKSLPVCGRAHNPPSQIRPLRADAHTTPPSISGGGYTMLEWSMHKYNNPDAIYRVLSDLNLELDENWITCPTDLTPILFSQLERVLIREKDVFFDELDKIESVNHKN